MTLARIAGLAAAALFSVSAGAAEPMSGAAVFAVRCAACHGPALEGKSGPPLQGPAFQARWSGHPSEELYAAIAERMPPDASGTLTADEYKAVHAFILAKNNYRLEAARLEPGPGTAAAPAPPVSLPAPAKRFGRATETTPTSNELSQVGDGWPMYNRDYRGQRFSPLKQITPANVNRLAVRCLFQTGEIGAFQSSPVVYGKRLYVTTAHSTYAIDATSCAKLWQHTYTPDGPEGLPVNRGVAISGGKLFRGTPDAHLLALDAATGALLWEVWVDDARLNYNINGAPAVLDGKVFIGEGGGDRGATGHIYAFDAETGKRLWTFNPVPADGEPGAETWGKGNHNGGGGSWTTISVDPASRSLYIPIGNPGSSIEGSVRPGDNLYSNSVIVLDAETGKLKWFVQQIPHDVWDWDTAAAPVLYDVGNKHLMATASKDGWLYLHDRDSHARIARSETTSHVNADKPPTPQGLRVCPGTLGGTEWYGPAFDPSTKLLFVPAVDWCATLTSQTSPRVPFGGTIKMDAMSGAKGWLRAFDAATGAPRWAYKAEAPLVAAVTPTASGLLFTGDMNGAFLAFDAAKGEVLYRFNTGGAVAGGISTYAVDGKQYVAVASGNASKTIWNTTGAPTVILFALP